MLRQKRLRADLLTLITLLVIASIVITLASSLYASSQVQREVLINNTLESNRVYATKLASTTEMFFQQAESQLAWSAKEISSGMDDDALTLREVNRLREQTRSFNSVVIVDANGWLKAISPESLMLKGMHLTSSATRQALAERRPLVSKATLSAANNLMVFVSYHIWSANGNYLGFIGGTIYLKKKSILNELLGEQFYRDGSSLYVVDGDNRVLYHQNSRLIGQTIKPLISDDRKKDNGYQQVLKQHGEPMLAGYAMVATPGWMIVAMKPTQTTLVPLTSLVLKVLLRSIPWVLLTIFLAWFLARLIAKPLGQLASKATQMDMLGVSLEIGNIRSWYYEASQIKAAMLTGIGLLQDKIGRLKFEVQTDPLTSLLNRRGLSAVLEYFIATNQPFAVLALDIDHFKRVNDTWGHDVGDSVIKNVAQQLGKSSRQTDVVCRNGGEEFLMILPGADRDMAGAIAERVRKRIEQQEQELVGHVTISIGVALWAADNASVERVFKQADDALYAAKNAGRNRVIISPQRDEIQAEKLRQQG
ncbi:sensor domain-containing diguanylate cyclase [Pantoea sp. CCBC3-3-1]|uniref:sensor domain-containing diguanylate cyclase n=1 Tax=Pantoea sp. CCBC3-3-1 TaxID=2490851 RepID=UPI0011BDF708|nr:sensor domain-containing diguanylate cyclase [Pantoea sp. CCBC3-3-1]